MVTQGKVIDDKMLYVICPHCKTMRQKVNGSFNIIKRGKERSGIARFLCQICKKWFNERSGDVMKWTGRI